MICTIYTDASYNPSTGVGAVGYRAKFDNMTFMGSVALPFLHITSRPRPGDEWRRDADIGSLELFGIYFAIHNLRKRGVAPECWFVNTDNLNIAKLFWPWEDRMPPSRQQRNLFADIQKECTVPVRVKWVRAHQNITDKRSWSNNHVDMIAKNKRRSYERNMK